MEPGGGCSGNEVSGGGLKRERAWQMAASIWIASVIPGTGTCRLLWLRTERKKDLGHLRWDSVRLEGELIGGEEGFLASSKLPTPPAQP